MVKAKIIEMIGKCFRIEYQPEGQGYPCVVLFDPENQKIDVEILAEGDFEGSTFYTQPLYGTTQSRIHFYILLRFVNVIRHFERGAFAPKTD